MATELFHELLDQAIRKDCHTIHQLNGLVSSFGAGSTTKMVKLADSLYELGRDFQDEMDSIAHKFSGPPALRKIRYRCPGCGDPYCLGAQPVRIVGG